MYWNWDNASMEQIKIPTCDLSSDLDDERLCRKYHREMVFHRCGFVRELTNCMIW